MAITAGLIAGGIGAAGSLGSGLLGVFAGNKQQEMQAELAREQLAFEKQNALQQQMVQQLVNQRAVAGTSDSMGTSVTYDPATNTWKTQLGALPQAATEAATRAGIEQNTRDRARTELANEVAMQRATQAGPAADAAARDVASFRPMRGDELTGLLTDQAVTAARQAYDPLRADVLRSTARTGTAAGPVLAELGRSEAANLRNSLIDAQVQGMTGVGNINQQRLGNLVNRASAAQGLATPNITTPPIAGDPTSNLLTQLTGQRAGSVAGQTSSGMFGANQAVAGTAPGFAAGIANVPNQNFGLTQAQSGLRALGADFSPTGSGTGFVDALTKYFGSGGGGTNTATTNPSPYAQDEAGNITYRG